MGEEILTPFMAFFLGDRKAEKSEEVLDCVFSPSLDLSRFRVAGLFLSFLDGEDEKDWKDGADPEDWGGWWTAPGMLGTS